jgi:tubulin polyglutamylase TTLL4
MEIYGFDVLVDTSFKPWLLEVNVAPSLSSSSPFDKHVKSMLLADTLHLVGFNIFDRRKIDEEKKTDKN